LHFSTCSHLPYSHLPYSHLTYSHLTYSHLPKVVRKETATLVVKIVAAALLPAILLSKGTISLYAGISSSISKLFSNRR